MGIDKMPRLEDKYEKGECNEMIETTNGLISDV